MERKYLTYPSNPIDWPASPRDLSGDVADVPYLGVYTSETTPRYTLGTRYTTWDGRVYKYSYAVGAVKTSRGCGNAQAQPCAWSSLASTSVAGSYEVSITTGATQPGTDNANTSIFTKDGLAGGYVILFDGGTDVNSVRGIVANDAVATSGGTLKLYLDTPLNLELTSSDIAEVMASPYMNVSYNSGGSAAPSICVPCVAAGATNYFWGQTWGPCWCVPQATAGDSQGGAGIGENMGLIFRHDGTIEGHNASTAVGGTGFNYHQQHAGFILGCSASRTQGAPFFMLQISI